MYSKGHVSTIRRQITLEKNGSRTFGTENGSVFRDTRSRIWFMATLNKSWSPELGWREIEERTESRGRGGEKLPQFHTVCHLINTTSHLLLLCSVSTDTLLMFIERRSSRCKQQGGSGQMYWPLGDRTEEERPSQRSFILLEDALRVDSAF